MDQDSLAVDGLVSVQEAARFLAISRTKLYELTAARDLEVVRIGRAVRIPRRALIAYVETKITSSRDGDE